MIFSTLPWHNMFACSLQERPWEVATGFVFGIMTKCPRVKRCSGVSGDRVPTAVLAHRGMSVEGKDRCQWPILSKT